MSKLTRNEIDKILEEKHLTCENIDDYENLNTVLKCKCDKGHAIEAPLKTIRNQNFKCPQCAGQESLDLMASSSIIPEKSGFRVVAIDNATCNLGLAVFDDGKLVYYRPLHLEGDTMSRIEKNRNFLEEVIIKKWQPDFIVVEDIQYQNNIGIFKTLAMLLGSTLCSIHKAGIKFEIVLSKVWRAHFMINAKDRMTQKFQSIAKVKEMYNISTNDDVSEAILLGKYAVDCLQYKTAKRLF